MSQAKIGRALGRSDSEIFRTLSFLEKRGYIRKTREGQYRLTLKLFELSRMHSPFAALLRVALPIMRDLSETVSETRHLTTLREGEIVVLAQHESPKPLRLSIEVGSRHAPIATTSGPHSFVGHGRGRVLWFPVELNGFRQAARRCAGHGPDAGALCQRPWL